MDAMTLRRSVLDQLRDLFMMIRNACGRARYSVAPVVTNLEDATQPHLRRRNGPSGHRAIWRRPVAP